MPSKKAFLKNPYESIAYARYFFCSEMLSRTLTMSRRSKIFVHKSLAEVLFRARTEIQLSRNGYFVPFFASI
jgi:hypothetical protein